jgi:hypothetical protein
MVLVVRFGPVKWILLVLLVCAALAVRIATAPRQTDDPEPPEKFLPERVQLPVDPTTELTVKTVRQAKAALNPAELVLGVTVGGESRAYPINLLNEEHLRYKVLNDTLGGRPIAATWCNACSNGIVYDRVVEGQTLVLGVSGQLWKESMVLYDQGTHSLWSHLLGECMLGQLQGKRLKRLPSLLTDWESWCRHYPGATVVLMKYDSMLYRRDFYGKHPERFVLGIAEDRRAKAWGFDSLVETPAINDEWSDRPVLAVLDRPSFTARLFGREVGGRVLTFQAADGKLTDRETVSTWEPISGRAVAGPLSGSSLTPLPATVSYRNAWLRFYPRSQ